MNEITQPNSSENDIAASKHDVGVRPWVRRVGAYLHIFGKPAPGTFGYRTSEPYLDSLIETAKRREDEFGGNRG